MQRFERCTETLNGEKTKEKKSFYDTRVLVLICFFACPRNFSLVRARLRELERAEWGRKEKRKKGQSASDVKPDDFLAADAVNIRDAPIGTSDRLFSIMIHRDPVMTAASC